MLIKYYTDYYDLDKVYKFTINDNKEGKTIVLYFPNTTSQLKQEVIYFSSVKDKEIYDRVVEYLMKPDVLEYNDIAKYFD